MIKNFIALTLATVILIGAFVTTPQAATTAHAEVCAPAEAPVAEDNAEEVHAVLRWVNASTWIVLDDAGHISEGVSSVEMFSDKVRIHYDFTADKVLSLQATSDEAFASANVRVGASVALTYADIYFYMPSYGSTPVPPALLSKAGANVWITGKFLTE